MNGGNCIRNFLGMALLEKGIPSSSQTVRIVVGISSFSRLERGTSSRCPKCGHKHQPWGRNWFSKVCGFTRHRDLVRHDQHAETGFQKKRDVPRIESVSRIYGQLLPVRKYLNPSSRPDTRHRKGVSPAITGVV
jgi:putative transposase